VEKVIDTTISQQVKFAIGKLNSLSILPCVAVQLFSRFAQIQTSSSSLAEIIESEPALCARILALMYQKGIDISYEQFSLSRALGRLPGDVVRDTLLSVGVTTDIGVERQDDWRAVLSREDLILHNLAVACCSADIAKVISPAINPRLAYLAGLLHDVGKFALGEVMPKAFSRIVEKAESIHLDLCTVEQEHFGVDHTLLGKSLAQRWHFPEPIELAVWLHHSKAATISQTMPEARIAQIVQSADSIARQLGIGRSGSYDAPEPIGKIAHSLQVEPGQLDQIGQGLMETVKKKARVLALDLPNATKRYCDIVHSAAAKFAKKQTDLSRENRCLQTASADLDFTVDFLQGADSAATAIDIAEQFASRWQRFYQTGAVCLYIVPPQTRCDASRRVRQLLEAVVVEGLSHSERLILEIPEGAEVIPKQITNDFAMLDAHDHIGWLFEQINVDFAYNRTKLVPLLSGGTAVGAIVFELHYPGDAELFAEKFERSTSIAGRVLDMAFARQRQERFAQRFAQLIQRSENEQIGKMAVNSMSALAEVAAGMAHELNNPLSVIFGRSELLAKSETDEAKKKSLIQIQDNAREASTIITDLMSFAKPDPSRITKTNTKQTLEEAVQLVKRKKNTEHIDIQIDITGDVKDVLVDSGQIASAFANIIVNSMESYPEEDGPVRIVAVMDTGGDQVRLKISDSGCGMDAETLEKAIHPFFSSKPAGRKRGMGLPFAVRLIQLNKGSFEMLSEPGKGTTVTILLPCSHF
jgi:putative nucleotidyltransferase with HDIG domain